jgi:hypothetical protein
MANIERGGVASIYVDGQLIEVKAEFDIKLGGLVRTAVDSSNATAGYTTKWVAPEFSMTAIDGSAVSIQAFKAISGNTLLVSLNNGKQYQLRQAFQVDDPTIKGNDASVDGLKFSGIAAQEIPAS